MGEAIKKIPTRTGMIDPWVVPFRHSVFKELESVLIRSTLEWTLATYRPFYGKIDCLPARVGLFKAYLRSCMKARFVHL